MVREVPSVPRTKEPRREEREESVAWASLPLDKLLAHMRVYRDQLYSQLRNTVLDTAKQVSCPIDTPSPLKSFLIYPQYICTAVTILVPPSQSNDIAKQGRHDQ